MKNKGKTKQANKEKATPLKAKRAWWTAGIVIILAGIGVILFQKRDAPQKKEASTPAQPPTAQPSQSNRDFLIGNWARTDSNGGYTIEIKSAAADGKLDASYFNPNPIHVARAEWQEKNGSLVVFVELRDVNYPGSTYTLNFLPAENRMTGVYFQAVEGVNFDVAFTRVR